MFKEFKQFALRGNVVDLAVGVIIGGAFGGIVTSLVNDLIMPPLGLVIGGADFSNLFVVLKAGKEPPPYASVAKAKELGAVTLNYGQFLNVVVNFLIVAFAIFLLVKAINHLYAKKAEETVPPPPPPKARQEELLEEIRDLLRRRD